MTSSCVCACVCVFACVCGRVRIRNFSLKRAVNLVWPARSWAVVPGAVLSLPPDVASAGCCCCSDWRYRRKAWMRSSTDAWRSLFQSGNNRDLRCRWFWPAFTPRDAPCISVSPSAGAGAGTGAASSPSRLGGVGLASPVLPSSSAVVCGRRSRRLKRHH